MTDLAQQTEEALDGVERLVATLEIIRESSGIPSHTSLHQSLGESITFLRSQRMLLAAHHRNRNALIRRLHEHFPDGFPYDLANVIYAEVEL